MPHVPRVLIRMTSRLEWRPMPTVGTSTYRGGRYCGPGWGFTREDILSGRFRELPAALDAIDAACQRHDQCYHDHGYFTRACNTALAFDLVRVVLAGNSTVQQRLDAVIMAAIFEFESLTIDVAVGAYRDLRDSFERMFSDAFSMRAVIEYHIERRELGY